MTIPDSEHPKVALVTLLWLSTLMLFACVVDYASVVVGDALARRRRAAR